MTFNGTNFEQLVEWAENDPIKLEAFRRREVDKLIAKAPLASQRRLRGLQFQIDSQCRLHKSALGRCVQISKMMHDSLNQLGSAIRGNLLEEHQAARTNINCGERNAEIIHFPAIS